MLNKKVFLIDIDGTICEDIKNEESHLYDSAKPIDGSREIIISGLMKVTT